MSDRIEKIIQLNAPLDRVWRAISDSREFGQWFGVAIDSPFVAGQVARGRLTIPGCGQEPGDTGERIMEITVTRIEPPRLFAYTWHPYAIDLNVDYGAETPTLVEFHLDAHGDGTRLTVRESGFDKLPAHRREDCLRMNTRGWATQLENVRAYVEG